ncbi:guanitoxin biosynthesis L-arginine gamma (S) hydroxylase [Bacillus vallismortis]|uniref:guanitoxin biosynthesis L-arginine gamma (S) hydroxylase n=1 Tax=Bacillus vallismortis TaxID=72361 RepID=UPI00228041A0|nr:guanitoxin biosynthesis L-arginine gamma (S) hydroxylase [Bacillus vallismortis]MCY7917198.1 fatty acid desaturase family protein [Bacillus vallismortis]
MDYLHYRFSKEITTELRPLYKSNNYRGLVGIVYDFLVIAVAIYLCQINYLFYPLSVLLIGSRQRALATILHDASHLCLAKNKKLNYFLGTYLSGYLIGQEFNIYKDSHVKGHHTHLGNPDKDPDYQYHLDIGLYKLNSHKHFLYKYILKPLFLLNIISYSYYVFKNRMLQFKKHPRQYFYMSVYWLIILAVIIYFGVFHYFLLFWVVPFFTSFMAIGWFIELAEHYPLVYRNNESLKMTRNRYSHWLEAFFLSIHGEAYHLTHHLQASIPYWNIKKAHLIMMKDENYKTLNSYMGGVFFSSNSNPPLIKDLIKNQKLPISGKVAG